MRRNPLPALLLLVVFASAAWLYFTPHLTLIRLQKAAESGDAVALERMVDFPALRTSLKENVRSGVSRRISRDGGAAAVIGGLVAGVLADPLVDAAVTPAGIAALTRGRTPAESHEGEAGRAPRDPRLRIDRGYESVSIFAVRYVNRDTGREHLALLLGRSGITGWKLEGIRVEGERR
jgi:hypothetical protein